MERESEVVDLGVASEETKGNGGLAIDEQLGQQVFGLIED